MRRVLFLIPVRGFTVKVERPALRTGVGYQISSFSPFFKIQTMSSSGFWQQRKADESSHATSTCLHSSAFPRIACGGREDNIRLLMFYATHAIQVVINLISEKIAARLATTHVPMPVACAATIPIPVQLTAQGGATDAIPSKRVTGVPFAPFAV
jgi:hypothetical protein